MDKRAFPRIPMTLDTVLEDARGQRVTGVIHDFCAGGIFVAVSGVGAAGLPAEGEAVAVNVSVRGEDFRLPARVARRLDSGLGLAFHDPDEAALEALQKMARDSHRPVGGEAVARPAGAAEILRACEAMVRDGLGALIRDFNANIEADLVRAAAEATSNVAQSRYFDAITAIKPLRPAIEAALREEAPAHVMELGHFALQPSDILEATWSGNLSLVDADVFEDFLTLSEIAVRANDRFEHPIAELERRLSSLSGGRIEARTNPVSPEALCDVFRDTIKDLKAHRDALLVIYRSFEANVMSGLGELYGALNRLLARHGVEPVAEQRPTIVRKEQRPRPAVPPVQQPEDGEATASAQPFRDHAAAAAGGPPPQPAPPGAATAAPPAPAAPSPPGAAPAGGPAAAAGVGGKAGQLAERARVIDAAYHTAQRLLDMEQGLVERTQELTLPRSIVTQGKAATSFSSGDVAAGLAELQQSLSPDEAGELSFEEMETRLFQELKANHPEKGHSKLGVAERNNLRLITNLLSALLSDTEVAEAIKHRIRRLRLPIHRVGLEDEAFITDPGHSARQVLDKLAGLEADMEITGGVLGERLDSLVDRILAERQHPADAFAAALPELDELRREQEEAYGEGVSRVVADCRQRAEFLRARRKDGAKPPSRQRIMGSPEEQKVWRQWIQRVDRLQEGDAVVLDRDTPSPRRAQLVWVDDNRDEFVFVDGRGRKSDSLSAHELAMGLRRGTTEVLPPQSLSPVERAMLDMLRGVQERLRREATHAPLTGLPNEREFRRLLDRALHTAVQEKVENVVGYLSLTTYKDTAKRFGSDAGAEMLRVAGHLLTAEGRDHCHFGDLGQGRFGLLLTETRLADVGDALERLLRPSEEDMLEWEGETIPVKFVIGLAELGPHTPSAADALDEATKACHRARDQGAQLGLPEPAQAEDQARHQRVMADWAGRLNATLKEDRLLLRAQKVMPLDREGGTRPFYELLLGLRDEAGEPISPREFLEAAEYYNQLVTVDRWVIRNVIQWLAGGPPGLDRIDGFTINLSAASLLDDALGDFVLELLMESSLPPGRLCFEVSQSDALAHHSNAERFIRSVTDLGCRIALHDFGHGDSSYAYLKDLPVDYIKIGGAFVAGMARNPSDHAVVNSINEIAHMMGKRTVAEHVESEAALVRLRDMGVDFAQGFYVARPRYLDELLAQGLDG